MKANNRLLILLILPFLLLTSCSDRSDIESDVFAAGIAIDIGEEKLYKVSAEILTTKSSGDTSNITSKVIDSEGDTVLEAISGMVSETSKKLNFDHCNIIILSSEIAANNLTDVLDLAFRDTDLRLSMLTVVAKNCKAAELLNCDSTVNDIKAYEIAETVKINAENNPVPIYKLLNGLNGIQHSAITPAFTLKSTDSDKSVNMLEGMAIFNDQRFAGFGEPKQTQFTLMASGDFREGVVTCYIPSHDQLMSVYILKCKRTLKTFADGKYASAEMNLDFEVDLPEIPTEITVKTDEQCTVIEMDISNYISQNVYAVITDTLNRYGSDIFGLSSKLLAQNRDFCRENADRWEQIIRNLKLSVTCSVKIRNSGVTNDRIIYEKE